MFLKFKKNITYINFILSLISITSQFYLLNPWCNKIDYKLNKIDNKLNNIINLNKK
jgi:hypothetical protein